MLAMISRSGTLQFLGIVIFAGLLLYAMQLFDNKSIEQVLTPSSQAVDPLIFSLPKKTPSNFLTKDLSRFLTVVDEKQVAEGLTIIPLSGPDEIIAIDTLGQIVNSWMLDAERARFLSNGHILVGYGSKFRDDKAPWKSLLNSLGEYDWLGKARWGYSSDSFIHHDHQRLENGNTLFLKKTPLPKDLLMDVEDPHRKRLGQIADAIVEVDPAGKIVWQWNFWESFSVNDCGKDSCTETIATFAALIDEPSTSKKDIERATTKITDWAHVNTVNVIPENQWFDAGDTRFAPGNLIVMPRKFKTVYIIDKQSKKVLWEYEGQYKGGLGGAHEPYMIAKGLPGAGNILIFDNGGLGAHPGESYVLEIQPVKKEVVWVYDKGRDFNIRTRGGAQRLWNGNTLISEDPTGRVFEVNSAGELVWEFMSPYPVNRAKRYPPDYSPYN